MVTTIPKNSPAPMPAAVNSSVVNSTRIIEVKTIETLLRCGWTTEADIADRVQQRREPVEKTILPVSLDMRRNSQVNTGDTFQVVTWLGAGMNKGDLVDKIAAAN